MIVGRYGGDSYTATARMIGAFVRGSTERVEWLAALSWIARLPEARR